VTVQRFQMVSDPVPFEYIFRPRVRAISPSGGRAQDVLTLTGIYFGNEEDRLTVYLGAQNCPVVPGSLQSTGVSLGTAEEERTFQCRIEGSVVGIFDITMFRYSVEAIFEVDPNVGFIDGNDFLFVSTPRISRVAPRQQWSGQQITLYGRNLIPSNLSPMEAGRRLSDRRGGGGKELKDVLEFDVSQMVGVVEVVTRKEGKNSKKEQEWVPCAVDGMYRVIDDIEEIVTCRLSDDSKPGITFVQYSVYGTNDKDEQKIYTLVLSALYFVKYSSPEGSLFLFASAVTMFFVTVLCMVIFYYRNDSVIKASSPVFVIGVGIGCLLACAGIILQMGRPEEDICMARIMIPSVALTVILSNLFVKTWRVWRIFDNKRLKRVVITNWDLIKVIVGLVMVDVVAFTVWFSIDPPDAQPQFGDLVCYSEFRDSFLVAIQGYKFLLLCFGAFLAYGIRNVQVSSFNESRQIAFSIYTVLLVFIFVGIINYNVEDLFFNFFVTSAGELLIIWGLVMSLLVPKVHSIYLVKTNKGVEGTSFGGTTNGTMNTTGGTKGAPRLTSLSSSASLIGDHGSSTAMTMMLQNSSSSTTGGRTVMMRDKSTNSSGTSGGDDDLDSFWS